ncbi:unnamed protein product [Prunus armeniaca]
MSEFTDRESEPRMFRFNNLKFALNDNRPIVRSRVIRPFVSDQTCRRCFLNLVEPIGTSGSEIGGRGSCGPE